MKFPSPSRALFLAAAAMSLSPLRAMTSYPKYQLVQSIPEETDLADPELPHAQAIWLEMIASAKKTIDLAQFYMSPENGKVLDPVIDALEAAARRGVKVRILISNALLEDYHDAYERLIRVPGITGRIYDIGKISGGGILHAKYWIVDGRITFVGSQNFDWRALTQIHETGIRIEDEKLADSLQEIFEIDWKIAETGKMPKPKFKFPWPSGKKSQAPEVELVASPPQFTPKHVRLAEDALLELIASAKESLQIQLLKYDVVEDGAYWPVIDNALRDAAVRGVKIQLIVSDWNTKRPGIDFLKSLGMVPGIEIRIPTIPEHSQGPIPFARVIHSKYLVVDSQVLWLGTSNWSKDYFRYSRNVELILRRPELARKAQEVFLRLWESSYVKIRLRNE